MKYQDHSTTLEAMNQNTEVNGETMQTRKFMGHERKQWKQAQSNKAKLQDSVLQSFSVQTYMLSVLLNNRQLHEIALYFPNSISHNEHSTHNTLPCLINYETSAMMKNANPTKLGSPNLPCRRNYPEEITKTERQV